MALQDMSLEAKIRSLPGDLQREVEDFVEFLLEKRKRAELEQAAIAHGWSPGFFSQTAGTIDDCTFIRHPQGDPEDRLSLE